MKKSFYLVCLICTALFTACQQEKLEQNTTQEIYAEIDFRSEPGEEIPVIETLTEISPDEIPGFLDLEGSAEFANFLDLYQPEPITFSQIITHTGEMVFLAEYHSDYELVESVFISFYEVGGEWIPVIYEHGVSDEGVGIMGIRSFSTLEFNGQILLDAGGATGGGSTDKPTCRQSSPNFTTCFGCAWAELHSGLGWSLTCSLRPELCAIAAAAHCAPLLV